MVHRLSGCLRTRLTIDEWLTSPRHWGRRWSLTTRRWRQTADHAACSGRSGPLLRRFAGHFSSGFVARFDRLRRIFLYDDEFSGS